MKILFLFVWVCLPVLLMAQSHSEANYKEAKVPDYQLPPLLVNEEGQEILSATDWQLHRRPTLLNQFAEHIYGHTPLFPYELRVETLETEANALEGIAVRKQVRIWIRQGDKSLPLDLLLYLPGNDEPKAYPIFLALNFYGNQSIHADPHIRLTESWVRNNENFGITKNKATDASRGVRSSRWSVEEILDRGYGLATMYYGDIDPDFDDGFQNGIHPFAYSAGQSQPKPTEWGSIGAWAWGLSRAVDYLQTDDQVDANRIMLMGHSRLGKAALWAGAQDERFAMVISNNSGCGGAALSKRQFGERVARINTSFPHWFNDYFTRYNEQESDLPLDQHQLIALMAPRPVYVASASKDLWADPRGEFLAAQAASPVYQLYGKRGLPEGDFPNPDQALQQGFIGYHLRTGKHDVTLYDWERYMDFADRHLAHE